VPKSRRRRQSPSALGPSVLSNYPRRFVDGWFTHQKKYQLEGCTLNLLARLIIFFSQVIMGLLFAPYILKLEFKSKEELQLMPQTTEEHMELENDDDDKSDSDKTIDGEVSVSIVFLFFFISVLVR
jgi:hypothetical protein